MLPGPSTSSIIFVYNSIYSFIYENIFVSFTYVLRKVYYYCSCYYFLICLFLEICCLCVILSSIIIITIKYKLLAPRKYIFNKILYLKHFKTLT